MTDLLIFFSFFFILLISVIGYGILFQNICFGKIKSLKEQNAIYLGFYGLFFLTFISVTTSLFVSHNHIHNISINNNNNNNNNFLHLIGILYFVFVNVKEKKIL